MRTISLDIETRSSVDLSKSGVYRYAESLDFEILLFSCSVDGGSVETFDLANGEELPRFIIDALLNENIEKRAWNAAFERICLSRYLYEIYKTDKTDKTDKTAHINCNTYFSQSSTSYLSPIGWRCTMIQAVYLGLPFSLEQARQIAVMTN